MKTTIFSLIIGLILHLLLLPVNAFAVTADITMYLELECLNGKICPSAQENSDRFISPASFAQGEEFIVHVKVKNPSSQALISVQSWLEYNPDILEGLSIETSSSFGLVAPGEKDFDPANSRIKIGVANISGGENASEIEVAKVRFRVKSNTVGTANIAFHDYQITELGKTNVNVIEEGFPVNVLEAPPKPLEFSINKDAPQFNAGGDQPSEVPVNFVIPRPTGLRVTTGNRYASLIWDQVPGYAYKLYYGNTPGVYLHQRDVGTSGSFYVTNLENDQAYFFAVRAYALQNVNNESDYSDEVAVVINHPETSTAPFYLENNFSQTKTGPALSILVALLSGSAGYVFTRKKRLFH